MENICIGIISYLPDDITKRTERLKRLNSLLYQCDKYLKLPIIIVAQNYKNDINLKLKNSKLVLYNFENKLGVTNARIKLREYFLCSEWDYMIFLDDDLKLSNKQEASKYISQIDGEYDFYYIGKWLLNFCCISKAGMMKINFDSNIDPEKGTGYEDWVFYIKCLNTLHSKQLISQLPYGKRSDYLNDEYSTWTRSIASVNNNKNSLKLIHQIRKGH